LTRDSPRLQAGEDVNSVLPTVHVLPVVSERNRPAALAKPVNDTE